MATEIVFVLDRSGSMIGMEKDVIGGFNSMLHEQKVIKGKARLTTVLFDEKYEILHDGLDIKTVEDITASDYFVRGYTALLDAVGKTINTVKGRVKPKDKVLFIVNTDGHENASAEFTNESVKALVKELEATGKWKFIFLGADVDAFAIGGSMGINITANFSNSSAGHTSFYNTTSTVIKEYRASTSNTVNTDLFNNLE